MEENTTFWLELLKQPFLFIIAIVAILVFIGMTYDFILKLFGMDGQKDHANGRFVEDSGSEDTEEPPEPTNVPKPPTPPNDTLKGAAEIPDGAEEVENGDGTTTVEFTYGGEQPWWTEKYCYAGDCLSPNWSAEGDQTKANSTEKERVN